MSTLGLYIPAIIPTATEVGEVATIDPVVSGTGFLEWNGSQFTTPTSAPGIYVSSMNQHVNINATPDFETVQMKGIVVDNGVPNTVAYTINLPTSAPVANAVLTYSGTGNVYNWVVPASITASAKIQNGTSTTFVSTIDTANEITAQANSIIAQRITSSGTHFTNGITMEVTTVTNANLTLGVYIVLPTDNIIIFTGTVNAIFNLPPTTSSKGRWLLIENKAVANDVIITPNGADTIDGTAGAMTINFQYGSVKIIGDGNGNWMPI